MNLIKSLRLFLLLASSLFPSIGRAQPAVNIFSTRGYTVYHLHPAMVEKNGARCLISAAYDGSVLCHTPEGKLKWKAETGGNFPFDLCVADIDGDRLDPLPRHPEQQGAVLLQAKHFHANSHGNLAYRGFKLNWKRL